MLTISCAGKCNSPFGSTEPAPGKIFKERRAVSSKPSSSRHLGAPPGLAQRVSMHPAVAMLREEKWPRMRRSYRGCGAWSCEDLPSAFSAAEACAYYRGDLCLGLLRRFFQFLQGVSAFQVVPCVVIGRHS